MSKQDLLIKAIDLDPSLADAYHNLSTI
jgi:hypothetical protein